MNTNDKYKGVVVEESLADNRILNDLEITDFRISKNENPADRWHLYTILITQDDIEKLSKNIKPKWYMHFWQNRKVVVIFKDMKFELNYDDKSTWIKAIEYGISIGIPEEQLDFPIN